MRIQFVLSPNTEPVPFDYQQTLLGAFHNWMGWNEFHDEVSLYSLSWLRGGARRGQGLNFSGGATWFISFWDDSIGRQLIAKILDEPGVCFGMKVREVRIVETPPFGTKERFTLSSPVFIRKYEEGGRAVHLTFRDEETDYYLTETMKTKLRKANLDGDVSVKFDRSYSSPKTKLVRIKGIGSRASFCPVIVEGSPEAVRFAWNVGVGHCTGSGFGAIY